jgi:hypothetical protein
MFQQYLAFFGAMLFNRLGGIDGIGRRIRTAMPPRIKYFQDERARAQVFPKPLGENHGY